MDKPIPRAYAAIVFVNIVWGLSFIASKYALDSGFAPFTLALIRFIMAVMVLLPITLIREGNPRFSRYEWWMILLSALLGTTLYFLFEYIGLQYTTASNASLILAVVPILTLIVGVRKHRKYPNSCWVGVIISLVGVYLVVRFGGSESGKNPLLGNLLLLGASICWVFYIEITSRLVRYHNSLSVTCFQNVLGMLTLIPLAMTERTDFSAIPMSGYMCALFLGLICSALCYILYAYALKHLKQLRTALFINLNPLSAVIGGVVMLNERLTATQLFGGVMILVSIFYVSQSNE